MTPKRTAAFFDLDLTLLDVNSAKLWMKFMRRRGELGFIEMMRALVWFAQYRMASIDVAEITRRFMRSVAGQRESDTRDLVAQWYVDEVRSHLYAQGRDLVEDHRARGHKLVLLTGSSPYISQLVSDDLGLDDFLCTRAVVKDGLFTGEAVEPVCFGEGKVHWAARWASDHGVSLEDSWFYTDSYTDLPMLDVVGHPVAVNPDPRLRRHAAQKGMKILDFTH